MKDESGISYTQVYQDFFIVAESKQIESDCVAIGFLNQGTSNIIINKGLILKPNDPLFSISMDRGYIDKTLYNINFFGGGDNNLLVIRTYFNPKC